MSLSKKDIIHFIQMNELYFKDHFHLTKIGLFGSFALDQQTDESDIDLLVEFEENRPNLFELKGELRNYFKNQFQRNVDIATEKYLKPYVKEDIIQETIYVEKR